MPYTVQQLATLAGVSTRTLHYYDEIGLLVPVRLKNNSYRQYGENELLMLQQILFFRELEFPLEEVKRIMSSPNFDMQAALRDQRKLIELKKDRLAKLMKTIDGTVKKINKEKTMTDKDLYGNFTKEEMDTYANEAKARWGNTDAYKQSQERVKKMGKDGLKKVLDESEKLTKEIAASMQRGEDAESPSVQKLIARHYDGLRAFYEPNPELYKGLAEMYVNDPRFKANYEKVAVGLAEYMRAGMIHYADTLGKTR